MSDRPDTPARSATRLATLVLLLAGLVGTAGPAAAQSPTPATTVKNSADNTRLQLNYDGGLYVPGTFGPTSRNDSIPATGAGTRLMWYPAKAAFRAGQVGVLLGKDDVWDADSVGQYSVAMGLDTKAQDPGAVALGLGTTAGNGTDAPGGSYATALGLGTTASGNIATAMGNQTVAATNSSLTIGKYNDRNRGADDNDSSTGPLFVVGNGSGPSSRSDALVLDQSGNLTTASGIESESGGFVLPDGTTLEEGSDLEGLPTNDNGASLVDNINGFLATGAFNSGSIPTEGTGTRMMWYPEKAAFRAGRVGEFKDGTQWNAEKVGNYSVAFGRDTKASGNAATAMGDGTTASGDRAIAIGNETTASGPDATAMGDETTASDIDATAMGTNTTANGVSATAMGNGTTATGADATAMGRGTTAFTDQSLSIGECNDANNVTATASTLFAVGNGSFDSVDSCNLFSDALVLDRSGNLTISGSLNENSDRRLKTAVEPLGGDILQQLRELRPVRFRFKNQRTHPSGEQLGLIAQDVRKEFPALVSKGSDGMLSLAYPKLTAVLLKGLQEQQAQIDRHQAQLDAKQAQIDSLKQRVQHLQQMRHRQERLAREVAALKQQTSSALPAGWGPIALLFLLVGGGGLGAGLLWRRR